MNLLDPSNVIKSMFGAGQYEKMYAYCKRLLDKSPDDMTALQNAALALICMERYDEALSYCDRVLRLRETDLYALKNRLVALEALHRYDGIIDTCGRILEISQADDRALTGMGIALTHLGRHEEALAYYDRALADSPDDVTALLNKGFSLSRLEQYEEALVLYDRAEEVDHAVRKEVSATRSELFERLGRSDEAFLAAQGVRNRDMARIMAVARDNDCSVFHQFCDDEFSRLVSDER